MRFELQIEDLEGHLLRKVAFRDGEQTIGRAPDCSIQLDSNSVSRLHARFFVHLGQCYVEDKNSANGVVVDGMRVSGTHQLRPRTTLVIGDHVVRFAAQPDIALGSFAEEQQNPRVTDPAPPTWRPSLLRIDDGGLGASHGIPNGEGSVGRTSTNDVQLVDPSVSRRHARFYLFEARQMLVDVGSANGSSVNGVAVRDPVEIREGDIVQFGDLRFVYTCFPDRIDAEAAVARAQASETPLSLLALVTALTLAVIGGAVLVVMLATSKPAADGETTLAERLESAGAAMHSQSWTDAVGAYEQALQLDPSPPLSAARREASASDALGECETQLSAARRLHSGTDARAAIAAYESALGCFETVDAETHAGPQAASRLAGDVVPAVVALHRAHGAEALGRGDFDTALQSLRTAARLFEQTQAAAEPTSRDELTSELRRAYVVAARAAYADEQWERARSLFDQAATIAPLSTEDAARSDDARVRSRR